MVEAALIVRAIHLLLIVVSLPAVGRSGTQTVWPSEPWETATPEQVGMDSSLLTQAKAAALTGGGSGMITRHGRAVLRWGDQTQSYDLKSSTKAIGVTAVGLALMDGKFASLHDPAVRYHPQLGALPEENKGKGWLDKITLLHLATQTAGFDKNGGYTRLLFEPGTKWSYSDGGPNWLAECVTLVYGRDLQDLDIVIARAGKSLPGPRSPHYTPIEPFLEPVTLSVTDKGKWPGAPYAASQAISAVEWAPAGTIVRKAEGGDNWPITWADDGNLYTAYGDGQGFEPKVDKKLSLGFAQIRGGPQDFQGVNVRSRTGEGVGEGSRGAKASGMLGVDGILYMLVRNVGTSQVGWSEDHAVTWHWCDWKFETSFGAPTFLNFGANCAGRIDNYVYVYSHDNGSAYAPADRMVMARVPLDRIRVRQAYEFFQGLEATGRPVWTRDIRERGAVFVNPQRCWRSGITYNAGLKRYLWCQILPFSTDPRGPRFQGGFGIYEAPEPWGPWHTVFYTENWDVGPGETSSFPAKWMSQDGRVCHLVFSGNDSFSVRRAELKTLGNPLP